MDHLRALAAFLVFAFHFFHAVTGGPVPLGQPPAFFPLALVDQGQTGVALFMTLSGYLFAKLLAGRDLDFTAFLWNRALRLAPLALLVIMAMTIDRIRFQGISGIRTELIDLYCGLFDPYRPLEHGLWSIVVESHFYVLLPLLLALRRWRRWTPFALVATALVLRALLAAQGQDIEQLAGKTILGRIDQFVLGMAAWQGRRHLLGRGHTVAATLLAFAALYWWYDGGLEPYAKPTPMVWVVMPTIEGAVYAMLIGWYDARPSPTARGLSGWIAKAGTWSYSIYLLHFFVVFRAAAWIDADLMPLKSIYVAFAWAIFGFVAMMPVGWLSFRYIEQPFLRFRRPYVRAAGGCAPALGLARDQAATLRHS